MTVGSASLVATLVWGAPQWLAPAIVIAALAAAALVWGYARLRGPRHIRFIAAALKATGIALLAAVLLDPLWSGTKARPGENVVVVLVDNGASMEVQGRDGASSPAAAFRKQLADDRLPWMARLRQDFDVRRYAFAERLEPRTEFETLTFDGRASSLHTALGSIAKRFEGRPLAGVVLMSDGIATDGPPTASPAKLPPIYAVLPPNVEPAADVSVARVTATQTAFEDAPVTVTADAVAAGLAPDEPLVCQVLDEAGRVVKSQEQVPTNRDGTASFRFQFRPTKDGLSFYTVRAAAKSQTAAWDDPAKSTEATLVNNRRLVQVDRGRGPYRILYVGGAPNPEYKFLGRALAEDPQVELVSLMRIARREPKFDFRTRAGETANPLFRGFDKVDDDTEKYDQPVFVRLGIKDERELRDGFPKTAEQLFAYHAVVLDDVEAEMFTTDQQALIARFASERGGGVLMLGGPDSFGKGGFARTPVADVLPVYLERTAVPQPPPPSGYRWQLTRDGWLEPWMRLRANEPDELRRLETMPPFRTLNHAAGIKPGATVLATAVDSSGVERPALVVQSYGRGFAAAMLVGDLWRWRLAVEPENQDLEKMWRQLLRRLTADVPGRVGATYAASTDESQPGVRLAVRARDVEYQPLDNAQVTIRVIPPDGKHVDLDAEPSLTEPGVYETTYVPRDSGAYRAMTKVVDGAGESLGESEVGWTNDPAADEFRRLSPDREALATLSQQTGGETIELDALESFAKSLAARPVPETVQTLYPLWHTPWVFILAIACLAGEWGLRRWKGMP